jgi:2-polyprenyl-6-methoxyphenol hydroxylase-like FAD-dependent oxidoreductase
VTVYSADGTSYEGDILAGADGVFSATRQEMWRAADREEPGAISEKDKTSMRAEYQCLFGISSPTEHLHKGHYDVTYMKAFSTMLIIGKEERVYWFLFEQMDQIYKAGNTPKFIKEDAEAFGERYCDVNLMPKLSVKLRDVWKNRTSFMLVAIEEAEYKQWTWGRIACVGDSTHKMTPNAGAGGNACVKSAAALANSIKAMMDKSGPNPSMEVIKQCLATYQRNRDQRILSIIEVANKLTRIQAMKGLGDKITAHYVIPNAGGMLVDMQSDMLVGAVVLDYLPPPPQSLKATLPFNQEQGFGKKESTLLRALLALPFLGLFALASTRMVADGAFPAIGKMLEQGAITWDGGSVPI